MFYIAKVDNDATAKRNEGPHQFFYLTCGVTDQVARTVSTVSATAGVSH